MIWSGCEAMNGGHGGSRRPATGPPKNNGRENALAIWVNVAASDLSAPVGESPPTSGRSSPVALIFLVTGF